MTSRRLLLEVQRRRRHEEELAFFGAPIAAGNGASENARALGRGSGDFASEAGEIVWSRRRCAALESFDGAGGAPEDFFEGGRIADHGEKKVGRGGNLLWRFGELGAGGDEFICAGRGAVPDGERVASLQEIHAMDGP